MSLLGLLAMSISVPLLRRLGDTVEEVGVGVEVGDGVR